jgi:alanine racemase
MSDPSRPCFAEIDLDAIAHNVGVLRRASAPAEVWAVVKADAYGHGAVPVARATLAAGATGLCVALVDEGRQLREAGIDSPILVLSQPPPDRLADAAWMGLDVVVATRDGIEVLRGTGAHVHLKLDTGMHRVGADPADAVAMALAIADAGLTLRGVMTHLALADEPGDPTTNRQLDRLDAALAELTSLGFTPPLVHAANSAGTLAHPRARFGMVRCGIAVYGLEPGPGVAHLCTDLRAAMQLTGAVSAVRAVAAGEGVSYGHRWRAQRPTVIATVPIGYADGVPRRLFHTGGEVLHRGTRRPIAGVVTMDQLMFATDAAEVGDQVVLLGAQGTEEVRVEEWAERLGTITYEITCGIGSRVPRRYEGSL